MSSHVLLFLIFLLIALFETSIGSVDPKFQACEPKTCGNNQNISYPFYIKGKQPPFCGYPRFELTCANNGFPILTTRNTQQYIVNEIFYNNQSLRVSILKFSQPNTTLCEIPLIHSFSQYSRRFSIASKQKEVLLFYGCNLSSSLPKEIKEHIIGCDAENKTTSVVAFYKEDPNLRLASRGCKGGMVNLTVEDEKGGNIEEALKRGFVLNWTASNCGECSNSGGRCGFDPDKDTYAFRCYCPDTVHAVKCDEQPGWTSPIGPTFSSVDPKFQACEPKTCGNNQNISYPFYIKGKQPPFCGYPRFELTCSNNGFPILTTSNNQYIVNEIFYNNQSLRVSIPKISQPNTTLCEIPLIHNFSQYSRRFSIASKQKEVLLFYGCDLSSSLPEEIKEHIIGCDAENETSSVVALYREDPNLGMAMENCKDGVVNTTVEYEKRGNIEEALKRGFVLNWTASSCGECSNSGGRCGFDLDKDTYAFRCYCPDTVHAAKCDEQPESAESKKTGHKFVVIIATTVSAAVAIGVLIIIIYCIKKRSWSHKLDGLWKDKSKAHQDFEAFLKNHGPLAIRRFSYLEIKKMTNSFAEKLGQGGYGGVFKGNILGEHLVAVKMMNRSKDNGEEFINEVASISRTSHVNIVTLLGFCFEGSKRALVYEYMANGSLEKFIYGINPMRNQDLLSTNVVSIPTSTNQHLGTVDLDFPMRVDNQLNCETLCQIAIGVARGLEYLHKGCNTRIFHFDIKPHNILLDENFCPKISDFGLAKICRTNESMVSMLDARGTPGYIAPEVFSRNFGPVSHKSDVYSFGMLVLEMVGGRKNINVEVGCTSEIYFPHWIYKRLELNEELALKNITNESDREKLRKMVIVSLWCIQTDPSNRPAMRAVVDMLEGRVETLQIPPKPFLSSPSRSSPHSSIN